MLPLYVIVQYFIDNKIQKTLINIAERELRFDFGLWTFDFTD